MFWKRKFQCLTSHLILFKTPNIILTKFYSSQGAKIHMRNNQGFSPLDFIVDVDAKTFLNQQLQRPIPTLSDTSDTSSLPPSNPGTPSAIRTECQLCCEIMKKALRPVRFEPCGHTLVCSECCPRIKKCIKCEIRIEKKVVIKRDSAINDDLEEEVKSVKTLKLHELELKVQDWEESYSCSICMERKKEVVFTRCGEILFLMIIRRDAKKSIKTRMKFYLTKSCII